MWPITRYTKTSRTVTMPAPPAITPNRAPGDMVTTSPTPGIFSEIAGFAPPRNGVPQAVHSMCSIGTAWSQDGHGQLGAAMGVGATGAAAGAGAGAGGGAWTGTAASTGGGIGA